MSKSKTTKRKNTSVLKSAPKLPSLKSDLGSLGEKNKGNLNSNLNQSSLPSSSKNSSSKSDTSVGSCYESAVNVNANREPSDVFSSYMKNAVLEEVLNAKKAALLQSPAVMKLLREEQLKKQRTN